MERVFSNNWFDGVVCFFEDFLKFDDYNDWYGSSAGIVMPLNIGYRFRFGSGFYINLGAFAGSYINFYDEWFDYDDYALHDESGYAHFFGYFEFGLGVEF